MVIPMIDYKSLYRYGGFSIDQKKHLARLLQTAEAATTSAELSRDVVHQKLRGKFARNEKEKWQTLFEGIRAAIDASDNTFDLSPYIRGWRNYELVRLARSWGSTIVADKSYALDGFIPSNDLSPAGGDWTWSLSDVTFGYGTANAGLGGNTDCTLTDNGSGVASSNFWQAAKQHIITQNHSSMVFRTFIKKIATPTSTCLVYLESGGPSYAEAYWDFNLATGADTTYSYNSEGSYSTTTAAFDSNYWEVICRIAPAAGLQIGDDIIFHIYPASATATDTQTIEVGNVEAYWDTTIAAIEGTDPVFLF